MDLFYLFKNRTFHNMSNVNRMMDNYSSNLNVDDFAIYNFMNIPRDSIFKLYNGTDFKENIGLNMDLTNKILLHSLSDTKYVIPDQCNTNFKMEQLYIYLDKISSDNGNFNDSYPGLDARDDMHSVNNSKQVIIEQCNRKTNMEKPTKNMTFADLFKQPKKKLDSDTIEPIERRPGLYYKTTSEQPKSKPIIPENIVIKTTSTMKEKNLWKKVEPKKKKPRFVKVNIMNSEEVKDLDSTREYSRFDTFYDYIGERKDDFKPVEFNDNNTVKYNESVSIPVLNEEEFNNSFAEAVKKKPIQYPKTSLLAKKEVTDSMTRLERRLMLANYFYNNVREVSKDYMPNINSKHLDGYFDLEKLFIGKFDVAELGIKHYNFLVKKFKGLTFEKLNYVMRFNDDFTAEDLEKFNKYFRIKPQLNNYLRDLINDPNTAEIIKRRRRNLRIVKTIIVNELFEEGSNEKESRSTIVDLLKNDADDKVLIDLTDKKEEQEEQHITEPINLDDIKRILDDNEILSKLQKVFKDKELQAITDYSINDLTGVVSGFTTFLSDIVTKGKISMMSVADTASKYYKKFKSYFSRAVKYIKKVTGLSDLARIKLALTGILILISIHLYLTHPNSCFIIALVLTLIMFEIDDNLVRDKLNMILIVLIGACTYTYFTKRLQALDNILDWMPQLFAVVAATLLAFFIPFERSWQDFLVKCDRIPRAAMGISKMTEFLTNYIEEAINTCIYKITGKERKYLEPIPEEVLENTREVMELTKLNIFSTLNTNPETCMKIETVYHDYIRLKQTYIGNKIITDHLNSYHGSVMNLFKQAISSNPKSSMERPRPTCVLFRGGTGVGKSGLMYFLAADILNHYGLLEGKNKQEITKLISQSIYARNAKQDFFDNYLNQLITVVDDFGAAVDSLTNPNADFEELLRMVNNFPYALPMASLNQKANTYFTSRFVFLSTNLSQINCVSMIDANALKSRIAFYYEVKVRPEYRKGTGQSEIEQGIDVNKVRAKFGNRHVTDIYIFNKVNVRTNEIIERDVPYRQIVDDIILHHESEETVFQNRVDSLLAHVGKSLDADGEVSSPSDISNIASELSEGTSDEDFKRICDVIVYEKLVARAREDKTKLIRKQDMQYVFTDDVYAYLCIDEENERILNECTYYTKEQILDSMNMMILIDSLNFGNPNTVRLKLEQYECPIVNLDPSFITGGWLGSRYNVDLLRKLLGDKAKDHEAALQDLYKLPVTEENSKNFKALLDMAQTMRDREEEKNSIILKYADYISYAMLISEVVLFAYGAYKLYNWYKTPSNKDFEVEVEPSSGKSKKKKPPKELNAIKNFTSKQAEEVCNYITPNFRHIYLKEQNGWRFRGIVVAVKGHWCIMNKHFLVNFKNLDFEVFKLVYPFHTDGVELPKNILFNGVDVMRGNQETDIWAFKLPKYCNGARNIVKHFMTTSDLNNYGIGTSTVLVIPKEKTMLTQIGSLSRIETKMEDWGVPTDNGEIIKKVFCTFLEFDNIYTSKGDCGALYIADTDGLKNKIVGFHYSTIIATGGASAMPLLQEDFSFMSEEISFETDNNVELVENILNNVSFKELNGVMPIGSARGVYENTKTSIIRTPIYNQVQETTVKPAVLGSVYSEVGRKALNKVLGEVPYIPQYEIDDAIESFRENLTKPKISVRRVLKPLEAVTGNIPEDAAYVRGINRTTSPGYPLCLKHHKGKKDLFGSDDYIVTKEGQKVLDEVERKIAKVENDKIYEKCVYVDTLKDETRPIEKVEALKTRLFSAAPVDYVILFRMYFLAFLNYVMENRIVNEVCVGIAAQSMDWNRLASYLLAYGNNMIAGDFSNYDGTLNPQILSAICDVISKWYNDGNDLMRQYIFDDIIHSRHIACGEIYEWTHSQPSGNPGTAVVNSMYNSIIMRIAYNRLTRGTPYWNKFNKFVRMVSYGDDNILSIKDDIKHIINQQSLSTIISELGMTYTDENKSGVSNFREITDIKFLKRGFYKDPVYNIWLAPLEQNSINERLNWHHKTPDVFGVLKQNIEGAIAEWALHDENTFIKWTHKISKIANAQGFHVATYDRNYYIEAVRTGSYADHFPQLDFAFAVNFEVIKFVNIGNKTTSIYAENIISVFTTDEGFARFTGHVFLLNSKVGFTNAHVAQAYMECDNLFFVNGLGQEIDLKISGYKTFQLQEATCDVTVFVHNTQVPDQSKRLSNEITNRIFVLSSDCTALQPGVYVREQRGLGYEEMIMDVDDLWYGTFMITTGTVRNGDCGSILVNEKGDIVGIVSLSQSTLTLCYSPCVYDFLAQTMPRQDKIITTIGQQPTFKKISYDDHFYKTELSMTLAIIQEYISKLVVEDPKYVIPNIYKTRLTDTKGQFLIMENFEKNMTENNNNETFTSDAQAEQEFQQRDTDNIGVNEQFPRYEGVSEQEREVDFQRNLGNDLAITPSESIMELMATPIGTLTQGLTASSPYLLQMTIDPRDAIKEYKWLMEKYSGFRADICLHLRFTIDSTIAGLMLLTYLPFVDESDSNVNFPQYMYNNEALLRYESGCNSIIVDPEKDEYVKFCIPYHGTGTFWSNSYIDLGKFVLRNLTNIYTDTNYAYGSVTAEISFHNVSFYGTVPRELIYTTKVTKLSAYYDLQGKKLNAITYKSFQEEADENRMADIKKVDSQVIQNNRESHNISLGMTLSTAFLGAMAAIPGLNFLAIPAAFLGSSAMLARAFGYSKPSDRAQITPVSNNPVKDFAVCDGNDSSIKLSASEDQGVQIEPLGLTSADEMSIAYITRRPNFYMLKEGLTKDSYFGFAANPFKTFLGDYDKPVTYESNTHLSYLSNIFRYWRGDFHWDFYFTLNKFQRMTAEIKISNFNRHAYRKIITLDSTKHVRFTFPYTESEVWQETGYDGFAHIEVKILGFAQANMANSPLVDVAVFVSAGENFMFAVPQRTPRAIVTRGSLKQLQAPDPQELPTWAKIHQESIGDPIFSLRNVSKRFTLNSELISDGALIIRPFKLNDVNVVSNDGKVDTCDMYEYISALYAYRKGGVRIALSGFKNSQRVIASLRSAGIVRKDQERAFIAKELHTGIANVCRVQNVDGLIGTPAICDIPVDSITQSIMRFEVPYNCTHKCLINGFVKQGDMNNTWSLQEMMTDNILTVQWFADNGKTDRIQIFRAAADDYTCGFLLGAPMTAKYKFSVGGFGNSEDQEAEVPVLDAQ